MSLSSSSRVLWRLPTHVSRSQAPITRLMTSASTTAAIITPPPLHPTIEVTHRTAAPDPAKLQQTPTLLNSSSPRHDSTRLGGDGPDHDRKVKLGKTLRILQERLPSLLQSPLPQEILAPNISLHLFPSTHPYLPTVTGRLGYITALWTSPIAWNRVPIIGNVRLEILSERMTSQPLHSSPRRTGAYGEQLIVKWRTATTTGTNGGSRTPSLTEQGEHKLDVHLRGSQTPVSEETGGKMVKEKGAFTGLFIFEFDKDGKIISHTIEHVDENREWEKGVGAKVVGLTDWLLGGIKGRGEPSGALGFCEAHNKTPRREV
ncbi:hypothetical protein F5Y15DRAFT_415560 [Xylariaceae sp. FL0016]|nr:hypothetical protein F5Y15DRAFT_415560 [Xylariaceae sp. FL0016]